MSKAQYSYCFHLGSWRVYAPDGTLHAKYQSPEEAKVETYRLNGWKLKPNEHESKVTGTTASTR